MNRKRLVGVVAVGSLAALGVAGTALASGSDDTPRPRATVSASPRAELSVSREAAGGIALRAAGGGTVESVEREVEHGRAVWQVDLLRSGVEHDIDVDAASGAVVRHRIGGGGRQDDVRPTASAASAGSGRHAEPGDDHGRNAEPGDDRGRGREAGDDHGRGGHGSDD